MEWMTHMNELLMYAIDLQVKWLDGKVKKWRENFGVQHMFMYESFWWSNILCMIWS